MNTGRPSEYSEAIAEIILEQISTTTKSLATICKENEDLPSPRTIRRWIASNETFCHNYVRAKEDQADLMADEIIEIADDGSNDTYINDQGKQFTDYDNIARSRLRVDSRKWVASKLKPKVYGDKVTNELTGAIGITWQETKTYAPKNDPDN